MSDDPRIVPSSDEALLRSEVRWIPWDMAVLCADCETVHNQPDGACPRCTSVHGILLARLLQQKIVP